MDSVSPWVALLGGLTSLISPCTLPMIPVFVASLTGPEAIDQGSIKRRLNVFFHSLSFVAGFSAIFVLLGSGAGWLGAVVSAHLPVVRLVSGALLISFGVFMLAALKVPWLNYEKRLAASGNRASGYARSFLIGILFALAWTPCAGPVLGSILTLAFSSESAGHGSYLLAFYSLGMALPLIAVGLAFESLAPLFKRIGRFSVYWYVISGILLIVVGSLIIMNKLNWFSFR